MRPGHRPRRCPCPTRRCPVRAGQSPRPATTARPCPMAESRRPHRLSAAAPAHRWSSPHARPRPPLPLRRALRCLRRVPASPTACWPQPTTIPTRLRIPVQCVARPPSAQKNWPAGQPADHVAREARRSSQPHPQPQPRWAAGAAIDESPAEPGHARAPLAPCGGWSPAVAAGSCRRTPRWVCEKPPTLHSSAPLVPTVRWNRARSPPPGSDTGTRA